MILRGSGETTAALTRRAAENGVRTLAHAEGGALLYLDAAADLERARLLISNSLDRLGVCNRLNLLVVHEAVADWLPALVEGMRELRPRRARHGARAPLRRAGLTRPPARA